MRARDFLFEAVFANTSPDSWAEYLPALLKVDSLSVGNNGEIDSSLELTDESRDIIDSLITQLQDTPPTTLATIIKKTELSFTNGKTYKIGQLYKSKEIKSLRSPDAPKKYWNTGAVSETFLGLAIFARFISESNITESSIKNAYQLTADEENGFSASGNRNDQDVSLSALNTTDSNTFIREYFENKEKLVSELPKEIKKIDLLVNSCISYVNTSTTIKDALQRADNGDGDEILIVTDGVSDQKGTKADLKLTIGGSERLLSLKANTVKQFGQLTGTTPEVITNFFSQFIPDVNIITNPNWPDSSKTAKNKLKKENKDIYELFDEIFDYVGEAYEQANIQLNQKLKDSDDAESVIDQLYNGILKNVQGDSENQILVILNSSQKNQWKELRFGSELREALSSFKLESSFEPNQKNHVLRIVGSPIDSIAATAMNTEIDPDIEKDDVSNLLTKNKTASPELLIQLRSYVQSAGPVLRNIVEMGPLLKSLTEVQLLNDIVDADDEVPDATSNDNEVQTIEPDDELEPIGNVDKQK